MSLENKLRPSIHELITPLQTKLKQLNLSAGAVFDKFSEDKKTFDLICLK